MVTLTRNTPKKRKAKRFTRITIVLPVGSKMPTIRDKWKLLPDGQIRATYTPAEYSACLKVFEMINGAPFSPDLARV